MFLKNHENGKMFNLDSLRTALVDITPRFFSGSPPAAGGSPLVLSSVPYVEFGNEKLF